MADQNEDEAQENPITEIQNQLEELKNDKPREKTRRRVKKVKESESASMTPMDQSYEDNYQHGSDD